MKKNILVENMKRFNTKNLNENIETNSDFIETVETIMVTSLKGENMTDMILAELGDFYNDVTASNNNELKQLYKNLRMTADESPKIQSAAAIKLFNYLHTKKYIKKSPEEMAMKELIARIEELEKGKFSNENARELKDLRAELSYRQNFKN